MKSSPGGRNCARIAVITGGGPVSYPRVVVPGAVSVVFLCVISTGLWAQSAHSEQVQIKPPLLRIIDPPSPDATPADLEVKADELRGEKLYLDAMDYYRAALNKSSHSAGLLNKIGITELMMQRNREAKKAFEQ